MSQLIHPATLTDYSARTWVDGKAAFASQFNTEYRSLQRRISQLNQATKDVNTRQAGTSEPTSRRTGQIWFDTSNDLWQGDPDGLGADDTILTRLKAYTVSLGTAGTDTFKARGVLEMNTTAVTLTGTDGNLMSYTLPANTLSSNGQSIRWTTLFVQSNIATATRALYFGVTPSIFSNPAAVTGTNLNIGTITRISATVARKSIRFITTTEGESTCEFGSVSTDIDFSADQIFRYSVTAAGAESFTQELLLIEYLP